MSESASRAGNVLSRFLPAALLAIFFAVSVAACGGSSSNDAGTPPPNNSGGGGGGGDGNGDGDEDEKPTGDVPSTELAPRESVVVMFSEPMDPESLQLGGNLGEAKTIAWSDDRTRVTLSPRRYWRPGDRRLTVDATNAGGVAMETLDAGVHVRDAFTQFQQASRVIGQPTLRTGESNQGIGYAAPYTLDHPSGTVAYSAEEDILFVPDTGDSRIIAFEGVPDRNNPNASFAVGQPDLWSSRWETSQSRLSTPQAVTADGGHLIVTEGESHRTLIYPEVPIAGGAEPIAVLGQASFDTSVRGCGPDNLRHVHGHFVTPSGKLMVADSDNSRILVWNEIPTVTGTDPDLVIGQRNFNVCAANDPEQDGNRAQEGTPDARTMHHPSNLWSDGKRVIVADQYNHRVLIWHNFPSRNFAPADVVLGQADFSGHVPNDDDNDGLPDALPSARTLNNPWAVWVDQGQLFVADSDNHRVLIWHDIPQTSFTPADIVLGQADFESNAPNAGEAAVNARGFDRPYGLRVIGDQLFVTDMNNSRVLIFDIEN